MIVVLAVVALLVIGLAVALALGGAARMSVHRTDPVGTAAGRGLPEGRILSDDLDDVRFDVAIRGYRMDQVDAVLDRLRLRLAELEEEAMGRAPGLPSLVGEDVGGSASMAAFPPVRSDDARFERPGDGRPAEDTDPWNDGGDPGPLRR